MDKDSEEEKEGLVHGGEVDPGVEGDEEHQLDEEAGVDEDVGEAGAESDEDAGGGGVLGGVDNTWRHHDTIRDQKLRGVTAFLFVI